MSGAKEAETAFPPAERGQHDAIEHVKDAFTGQEVFRLRDVTQIDRYWRRGLLGRGDHAKEAAILREVGNDYGRAVYAGCLGPRYAKLNLMRVATGPVDNDAQAKAAEMVGNTDEALGLTHASIMRAVCAEGWTAHAWAIARAGQNGWGAPHRHFGISLLRDALRVTRTLWGR